MNWDARRNSGMNDRQRPRVGIFDASEERSGLTRYVESIFACVDPREFDLTLFRHSRGPKTEAPWVKTVIIDEEDDDDEFQPASRHSQADNANQVPGGLRSAWRACAPAKLKLWAGYLKDARRLARLFARHPVDLLHMQVVGCEEAAVGARLAGIKRVLGTFQIDVGRGGLSKWVLEFA